MREGIGEKVVEDFHDYIGRCIIKGLWYAVGQLRGDMPTETIMEDIRTKAVFR
jgi:hypothetical protein